MTICVVKHLKSGGGRRAANAVTLLRYLVLASESPEPGAVAEHKVQKGERLAGAVHTYRIVQTAFPDANNVEIWANDIADQITHFTERERGSDTLPKHFFRHLVMSVRPADVAKLGKTAESQATELNAISRKALQACGLGEQPLIVACHADRAHVHAHLMVLTSQPAGTIWSPGPKFHLKMREALASIDKEMGMKGPPNDERRVFGDVQTNREHALLNDLQDRLDRILAQEPDFVSFLAKCHSDGISLQFRLQDNGQPEGIAYRYKTVTRAGKRLGLRYSWWRIRKISKYDKHEPLHLRALNNYRSMVPTPMPRPHLTITRGSASTDASSEKRTESPSDQTISRRLVASQFDKRVEYRWRRSRRLAFVDLINSIEVYERSRHSVRAAMKLALTKGWPTMSATGTAKAVIQYEAVAPELGLQTFEQAASSVDTVRVSSLNSEQRTR